MVRTRLITRVGSLITVRKIGNPSCEFQVTSCQIKNLEQVLLISSSIFIAYMYYINICRDNYVSWIRFRVLLHM